MLCLFASCNEKAFQFFCKDCKYQDLFGLQETAVTYDYQMQCLVGCEAIVKIDFWTIRAVASLTTPKIRFRHVFVIKTTILAKNAEKLTKKKKLLTNNPSPSPQINVEIGLVTDVVIPTYSVIILTNIDPRGKGV